MAAVCWVGDRALLAGFAAGDLAAASRAVRALLGRLRQLGAAEVEDLVPGARSLLVVLRPGAEPRPALLRLLEAAADDPASEAPGRLHEIAVSYQGEDLGEVARLHGLSTAEVAALHSSVVYDVGFLGFSPGFPYLIGLPPRLATPRLATPRMRVPAGSVAIGGAFTGIYPAATPGGWRLIGHTDVPLFDPSVDPPALLAPGDRVQLVPR